MNSTKPRLTESDSWPGVDANAETIPAGADIKSCLAGIAKSPLHYRYVWRIAAALRWGFADYDSGVPP
jgi:hypothetical protein